MGIVPTFRGYATLTPCIHRHLRSLARRAADFRKDVCVTIPGTIGFIGFGNMGGAILAGLIERGVASQKHAVVFDPCEERRFDAERLGIALADTPEEVVAQADILVIAVKPQQFEDALGSLADSIGENMLVVSIMAGVSLDGIRKVLHRARRVVRVMPNLPVVANAGASAIALSGGCTEDDKTIVRAMFEAIGIAEFVEEDKMDAITALSGSGPAYFFYMVECLTKAAEAQGLSYSVAERLASQTLLGAGLLVTQSEESATSLREQVTSKGGTTHAALEAFRERDFEGVIKAGIDAATARSKELGA